MIQLPEVHRELGFLYKDFNKTPFSLSTNLTNLTYRLGVAMAIRVLTLEVLISPLYRLRKILLLQFAFQFSPFPRKFLLCYVLMLHCFSALHEFPLLFEDILYKSAGFSKILCRCTKSCFPVLVNIPTRIFKFVLEAHIDH